MPGASGGIKSKTVTGAGSLPGVAEGTTLSTTFTATAGKIYTVTFEAMYIPIAGATFASTKAMAVNLYVNGVNVVGNAFQAIAGAYHLPVFLTWTGTVPAGAGRVAYVGHLEYPWTGGTVKHHTVRIPKIQIFENSDLGAL